MEDRTVLMEIAKPSVIRREILGLLADGKAWAVAEIAEKIDKSTRKYIDSKVRELTSAGILERNRRAGRYVYWLSENPPKPKIDIAEEDIRKVLTLLEETPMTRRELATCTGGLIARKALDVLKKRNQIHTFSWTQVKGDWCEVFIAGAGENLSLEQFHEQKPARIERARQAIIEHVKKHPGIATQDLLQDLKRVPHVTIDMVAELIRQGWLNGRTWGEHSMLHVSCHLQNVECCAIWDAATRVIVQKRIAA